VARDLAERASALEPGDVLPSERQLIEEFQVGRSTMREALRILELLGVVLVKAGPRGGPVVLRAEPEALAQTLSMALQAAEVTFQEVLRTRQVIEVALASGAATERTDEELATMKLALELAEKAPEEEEWLLQNAVFHDAIARAGRNTVLAVFHASLKAINDGHLIGVAYSERRRKFINEVHRKIYDAIAAQDATAAAAAMDDHMVHFLEWLRRTNPAILRRPVKWLISLG
jgi:DNA-binding FadR family transcriptional regulator